MTGPRLKLDQAIFLSACFTPMEICHAARIFILTLVSAAHGICFIILFVAITKSSAGFLIGPLVLSGLAPITTALDLVSKVTTPPLKAQVTQEIWDLALLARRRHMFTFVLLIVYSLANALLFTIRFVQGRLVDDLVSDRLHLGAMAITFQCIFWSAFALACCGFVLACVEALPPRPPYRRNYEVSVARHLSPRHSRMLGHVEICYDHNQMPTITL